MPVLAMNDTRASTVDYIHKHTHTHTHTRTHTHTCTHARTHARTHAHAAHLLWGLGCSSLLEIHLSVLHHKRRGLNRCH